MTSKVTPLYLDERMRAFAERLQVEGKTQAELLKQLADSIAGLPEEDLRCVSEFLEALQRGDARALRRLWNDRIEMLDRQLGMET